MNFLDTSFLRIGLYIQPTAEDAQLEGSNKLIRN